MPQAYTKGPYRKSHLVRPTKNTWKFKRAVPRDLQGVVGKTAWVKYLGDIDSAAAQIAAHTEDARNGALIKQLRTLSPDDQAEVASKGGVEKFLKLYATISEKLPPPTQWTGRSTGIPYLQAVAKLELPSEDVEADDPESSPAQAALMIVQAQQAGIYLVRLDAEHNRRACIHAQSEPPRQELTLLFLDAAYRCW